MDKRIAIGAVAAIAVVGILFLLMQPPKPTGLSVGFFAGCPDGICGAGENYSTCPQDCCSPNGTCDTGENYRTCPQDCCNANCTAMGDPQSSCTNYCNGYNGCALTPGCNGKFLNNKICDAAGGSYITCCEGASTPCGSNPKQYCYNGACYNCSTECDTSCQSSACYGIDPNCTSSGEATKPCCGNIVCDIGENNPSSPNYCPGDCCEGGDCCQSDCTAENDSVCHAECVGHADCDSIVPACNGLALNQKVCADPRTLVTCCSTQAICVDRTYCSGGASVLCSTVCDNSCQSSSCYITDPDCDFTSGNATRACCGNSRIEGSELCDTDANLGGATCISRGYAAGTLGCTQQCTFDANQCTSCQIECDENIDCDSDHNALTVDVCAAPNTCAADCSRLCIARCADNTGCNDNNSLTTDVCNNAGTCDANCTHTFACPIPIVCDENADCSDNNPLTLDICNNPNTCSASCSHQACSVACWNKANCNDNNPLTTDACINPGDCAAKCSNLTCPVACDTNLNCNDNNAFTADVCLNPSTCNAKCFHSRCVMACSADANCNDNNAVTIDKCLNPGGCNAACSHSRQQLSIEFQVGFEKVVVRGRTVDLTLMVKDDADNPVSDANVYLTDAEGNKITLSSVGDGYYKGQYSVPSDSSLGTKRFSFSAASGDKVAYQELSLDVAKGNINVVLVQPTELSAAVGQEVEIKFKLVYDNNVAVQGATANAVLKGTVIPLLFDGTVFTGKRLFGEADAGEAALVINAVDTAGNSGTGAFTFNVVPLFPWVLVILLLLLVIAIAVALFVLKKKRVEKQQGKWVFKKEEEG